MFYMDYGPKVANQKQRWRDFLRATRSGRLLDTPRADQRQGAAWTPYKTYHEQIQNALQSSYADVEKELRVMTAYARAHGVKILFVAGDGLALMRLNHLLKAKSSIYLDMTPVVIPIQGEHPHGLFHVMHAQWRLYIRFLSWCAEITENEQVVNDPNVSVFNAHRYFYLHIVVRACAEYIIFIAGTPGADDLDDPARFIRKAEANADFSWVCHFLYDAGFLVLDFLQAVRANDSHKLDLLWNEFFASAHTGTAHKTQYVPMAIMRVFWGCAMTPDLHTLYHTIRTIDGCGWDMAIERLNAAIKAHVHTHVSHTQVRDFLLDWALVESVTADLHTFLGSNPTAAQQEKVKNATPDVNKLVAALKKNIGDTWQKATAPKVQGTVLRGAARGMPPWEEMRTVMLRRGREAPHAYVQQHVDELTAGFFNWQ